MQMSKRAACIGAMAALAALGAPAAAQPAVQPARVFAAVSLTDALNELGAAYAARGRAPPIFVYAASSTLARQIEQGARADLFISADEQWMDYLAARRLIDARSRTSFLSNRLVLVAPADRPLELTIRRGFDLHGALGGERLAMADPESVPAGRYGRAALESLGVWGAVSGDIARTDNVRSALRFVELGEAAAGIVYRSDAIVSRRVRIIGEFPAGSHPRISYPMALVRRARGSEAARFAAFLRSDAAAAVFERLGFISR